MSSSQSLTDWIKNLDIFGKHQGRIPFDLDTTLKHLSHLLPNQGPIKDFIHHNPLHGFQNLPFHDGVALASRIFGSKSYLDLAFYESQFSQGKITEDHLDFILNSQIGSKEVRHSLKAELLSFTSKNENRSQNVREWGLRSYWNHHYQIDLANTSSPLIYKILSHYLDQGIAFWPFTSRKDSLWLSCKKLQEQNFFPLLPFSQKKLIEILSQNPTQAIETALTHLVGTQELFTRYLVETLLSYPGWSGMVCSLENNPSALRKPTSISLKEFLALALSVEYLIVDQEIPTDRVVPNFTDFLTQNSTPVESSVSKLRPIWHEAFEWSFYDQLLRSVYHLPNHKKPPTPKAWAQAIFCIDDRECSLRRYLEMIDPGITTFGTAGFFGVDFWFLAHNELYPLQQSPVTITPKHLIRSRPKNKLEPERKVKDDILETAFGGLVKDLFLVPFLSVSALTQLVKSIFFHKSASAMASSLTQFESQVVLEFTNSDSEAVDQRFKNGFTVEEMTERVARTLRTIGLTKDFADSIYVIAHGASSSNNPHYAAYDCGACSGKSGAPNARALAWMANYLPVREKLKAMGIHIPESTTFYATLHDTTQDRALFFEEDLESKSLPASHLQFKSIFRKALDYNAKERSRRLDLVPKDTVIPRAAEMMAKRAYSIFEPRPELNHATNAAAIVGRRELTRGLFLDRRSFLQSYDPFSDPNGNILEGILGAVIPVCGGINLEYFFSRVDNEVYGAGTKLSHNVVGLMGVANGVNNDLIPGLPLQMIEAHDPVRLLILIDQEPEIIKMVLQKNPFLYEWVNHHWVRLASFSPTQKKISIWTRDGWSLLNMENSLPPPIINNDPMVLAQKSENLSLGFIDTTKTLGVSK